MKKMKKILAVLSSVSMMLGTMGMSTFADEVRNEYGRTLSEQALYDAENAKEQLAELLAELEEMGYTENEQTKFLETYIEGALEVAASGETYTATPTELKLSEIPENITSIKELEDFITSPVEISAEDFVWLNTKLTKEELEELVAYFNMESDNISDKLVEYLKTNGIDEKEIPSLVKSYYEGALEVIESGITYTATPTDMKTNEEYYYSDTIVTILEQGRLGGDNSDTTKIHWSFEGTNDNDGIFSITARMGTETFELEEILDVAKNYNVTLVYINLINTDMSVLPAELQNCETIEEAEAELLRLINEAKEEEQSTEETTEATVPTEVTETTEAVEEKTAETIAESVVILADEITKDKTEITLGDVNGNGNVDVRDCSFIAREIAGGKAADIPNSADFNGDGEVNVRDAAAIATHLASK